jgi:signal transduction histidine kinase
VSAPARRFLPSSILGRIAVLVIGCALIAVLAIYISVAPFLRSTLRDQKLSSLQSSAERFSQPLISAVAHKAGHRAELDAVRTAASVSGDRVTLLSVTPAQGGLGTTMVADSSSQTALTGGLQFTLAAAAAGAGYTLTGTEMGTGGLIGEAALPLRQHHRVVSVVVFSEPLGDVQRSVSLINRRILIAGGAALALAAVAGLFVARALSMRIRRLQEAAQRVAAGDFSARFASGSSDELGQLAHTLDDMQRQLAELDSARERFIATASHELRTPIFSLGGFLELIQDEELDEETRLQFLGQLRAQVDRLGKLATGLLDLSRLEAGALELDSRPADLGVIARTVTGEFLPALSQHESHLRLRLHHERIPVRCDPDRVAQILRILIDNALTHTPPGTDIVVTAGRLDGGARVAVRDAGTGIAGSAMGRIFEPFFTSEGVQGSGLGLAIARELAERMHGELGVESVPGRTVFTLKLPA